MYYLGIDIGSLSCDAVLIDESKKIISSSVIPTGAKNIESINRVKGEVIRLAGVSPDEVNATVSTGYGRDRVENRLTAVTEITCHAKGISENMKGRRILIDIGGQDSKAILLKEDGNVIDFAMNDKCAAGTGRFLEAMARALQVDIEEMSEMDHGAIEGLTLSSMCTVFAESEVVSLIAEGVEMKEIIAGMNRAIASRTRSLVKRVMGNQNDLPIAMSGGVARNKGVVRALSQALGCDISIPDEPDTIGAFGAALIAFEKMQK